MITHDFRRHFEFFDKPILLTEDEKKHPLDMIAKFLGNYGLAETRKELAELTYAYMTNFESELEHNPHKRVNKLGFMTDLERFIEAVMIEWEAREKQESDQVQNDPS